jgi:hypothetical protein
LDDRLAPVFALFVEASEADVLHDEACTYPHLGSSIKPWVPTPSRVLCGLAESWGGYSDRLVERGCGRMIHAPEMSLLGWAESPREPLRYAALATLYRVRAVGPSTEVVRALLAAPVQRLPWLGPVVRRVRAETSWELLREGVCRGDGWSLGACAARLHPEAAYFLSPRLEADQIAGRRADAVWLLGRLGDRLAIPALIRELSRGRDWSDVEAAWVLAEMGVVEALPALRQAAARNCRSLAYAAVGAIGALGGIDELPFLEDLAGDTDDPVAGAAAEAFTKIASRLGPNLSGRPPFIPP